MKQTWEALNSAAVRYAMLVIVMMVAGTFFAESASAVTIVFVHGKGDGKKTVADVTANYWTSDMIRVTTKNNTIKSLVVTYDGRLNYWDATQDVAAQINTFISQGNRDIVFVCHSMGGLVMRFILCNADPSDPYYNYKGNYAQIQANTRHVMTLATPHKGSEAADLAGTLSSTFFTSWIVSLVDGNVDSTKKLTTAHLQYASTQWLRDGLRSKAFYTLAGTGLWNDFCLECVGLATLSGLAGLPGEDDGLVAQYSAHAPGAPGGDWYNTDANHHYNRRNSYRTIGSYLAQSGGY